jgi:hypothetical protein
MVPISRYFSYFKISKKYYLKQVQIRPMVALQTFSDIIYTQSADIVAQKNNDSDGNDPIRHSIVPAAAIQTATDDPGPLDNNPSGIGAGLGHVQIHDRVNDLSSSLFQGFNLRSLTLDLQKPFEGYQTAIAMKYSGHSQVGHGPVSDCM